ncbi:putative tripartite motif-containing protein 16-like [Scophthalmus maximus]|uniref:Putative tripartite motif-containing protein 16-like n=1 Tax=Scophthalmus maximus TaxID=52904 RepID=A0A2U9BI82_SCOMX|nr:putative tripartite motif-containing protein 16-like [Scophthalmus maximus]
MTLKNKIMFFNIVRRFYHIFTDFPGNDSRVLMSKSVVRYFPKCPFVSRLNTEMRHADLCSIANVSFTMCGACASMPPVDVTAATSRPCRIFYSPLYRFNSFLINDKCLFLLRFFDACKFIYVFTNENVLIENLGKKTSTNLEVPQCIQVETNQRVSAAAERTERQRELELSRQQIQQRVQDREKDVKLLQQELEAVNGSADKAVEDSEKISELLTTLTQQIRSQQETEVNLVKDLQEKLEQEITELKRKDAELKQLSHTEDHNQFLHNYPSLSPLSPSTHSSSIDIRPLRYFEAVTAAVSEVRGRLQDVLTESETNISLTVTQVDVLLSQPEPKTREEFLTYSQEITLDPNTAMTRLLLSEGNRKVTFMREEQFYSSHPDRFTNYFQVLSRESLTGRCYWEVEWREGVNVAVAYKNIIRAGISQECAFGFNDKSWRLECCENSYNFYYNSIDTPVSGPWSSRVGVYLDHSAGVLSFYSVSDTMTLLHRVQTTFTQPLFAGVYLYNVRFTAEFCKLK